MNHNAFFDSLAIPSYLDSATGPVTAGEIQLFAYLGCLLWLYSGNPSSDWGYGFTASESGAPYSYDLDQAISLYFETGFLGEVNGLIQLTEDGKYELAMLSSLVTYENRMTFLEPACSSALAVPVGLVRSAVHLDSNIWSSLELQSSRHLFDQTSIAQLYEQFEAIRLALGEDKGDLLSPAVTWASYFGVHDLRGTGSGDEN